ncbi:unnamed protein product [Dicrocoelium dendriticum]|nr:unnamed protein product [Dicrocoelium dendriticum]
MSVISVSSSKRKSAKDSKAQKLNDIEQYVDQLKSRLKSSEDLLPLTNLTLTDLQARIRHRHISPSDLLHAFQAKAVQLMEKGNSGICEFVREAERQAKELTISASFHSDLYGIPISVKELCCIQGYDATFGLLRRCGKPAEEDCVVVKVLKKAGAIPFVLTATSQMALTTSGINPVFGNMWNPYSVDREPGGSSNGEAVLLVQRGSPLGIGTDLAGSIRIPCAFCGLTGLKPTSKRLSNRGIAELFPNSVVGLTVVAGPMGHRVSDLVKAMRSLLHPLMSQLDPAVPDLPFNETLYKGRDKARLVIGFYETLADPKVVQTVPSVRRAVHEAVERLRQHGHDIVRFDPPEPRKALKLGSKALAAVGGKAVRKSLSHEPLNEYTKPVKQLLELPSGFLPLAESVIRKKIGEPAVLTEIARGVSTVSKLTDLLQQLQDYRKQFEAAWMRPHNIDVLVCPVWAFPAYKRGLSPFYANPPVIYCFLYNIVDYPAGVVPMGKVNQNDTQQANKWAEDYKISGDSFHEEVMRSQLGTEGLPLSVQVVGKPLQEELVLRVLKELESR